MKLYVMRHGEALSPHMDIKRPLTEQGCQQVVQMAGYLQKVASSLSCIYHSGVLRGAQTAQLLAEHLHPNPELRVMNALNDPEGADIVRQEIEIATTAILLVGHIPLLPRLLSQLVVRQQDAWLMDFHMPATLVGLESLEKDRWIIEWAVSPALLSAE